MPDPLPWLILTGASGIDGVRDAYDVLLEASPAVSQELGTLEENGHDLESIVEKLNAFYRPAETHHPDPAGRARATSGSSENP